MDRLDEFEEEYNEAGKIMSHEYQWTIYAVEDRIYQTLLFNDEEAELHWNSISKEYMIHWISRHV